MPCPNRKTPQAMMHCGVFCFLFLVMPSFFLWMISASLFVFDSTAAPEYLILL